MKSIEEQRKVEIRAGFSPKPIAVAAAEMASSPSGEPETPSPTALFDGPLIQRVELKHQSSQDIRAQDGIVSFGK